MVDVHCTLDGHPMSIVTMEDLNPHYIMHIVFRLVTASARELENPNIQLISVSINILLYYILHDKGHSKPLEYHTMTFYVNLEH